MEHRQLVAEHDVLHLQLGNGVTATSDPQHTPEHEIREKQDHESILRNPAPRPSSTFLRPTGHSTEVTRDFTTRMSQLDDLRTRAEQRVRTLKSDCSQQLLLQLVCDAGVNY